MTRDMFNNLMLQTVPFKRCLRSTAWKYFLVLFNLSVQTEPVKHHRTHNYPDRPTQKEEKNPETLHFFFLVTKYFDSIRQMNLYQRKLALNI